MPKHEINLFFRRKNSIKQFFRLCQNLLKNIQNIQFDFKIMKGKKKIRKITVLKSPHVNKSAQEHFKMIVYKATIFYLTKEVKKNFIITKKIKNHIFSDKNIKIKRTIQGVNNRKENTFHRFTSKFVKNVSHKESICVKQQQQKHSVLENLRERSHKNIVFLRRATAFLTMSKNVK